MSTKSLKEISKKLGKNFRADILKKLSMKSYRHGELYKELSEDLKKLPEDLRKQVKKPPKISKERISEALSDLVESGLVILFEREAIGEKIYVASPFGSEILDISDKLDSIKKGIRIADFGDGIEFILKYYLGGDFKVNHKVKIRNGVKIELEIKGTPCEMKKCDITCEPVIKNIVKRFGHIDDHFEKPYHAKCSFKITLIRKK